MALNSAPFFVMDYSFLRLDFKEDLKTFFQYITDNKFGVELDLDAIAYMPSSAFSPSGMSVEEARTYILQMAKSGNVRYLHLPEAAPKTEKEDAIVGKTLAYLVSDFIKSNQSV